MKIYSQIPVGTVPLFKSLSLAQALLILYFSLLPSTIGTIPAFQIPIHFLAYLVYGFLLTGAFSLKNKKTVAFTIIIGTGFGFFMEILQLFVPGRFFELMDVMENFLGVSIGGLAYMGTRLLKTQSSFESKEGI